MKSWFWGILSRLYAPDDMTYSENLIKPSTSSLFFAVCLLAFSPCSDETGVIQQVIDIVLSLAVDSQVVPDMYCCCSTFMSALSAQAPET